MRGIGEKRTASRAPPRSCASPLPGGGCPADAVRLLTLNVHWLADRSYGLLLFGLLERGGWDVVVL